VRQRRKSIYEIQLFLDVAKVEDKRQQSPCTLAVSQQDQLLFNLRRLTPKFLYIPTDGIPEVQDTVIPSPIQHPHTGGLPVYLHSIVYGNIRQWAFSNKPQPIYSPEQPTVPTAHEKMVEAHSRTTSHTAEK